MIFHQVTNGGCQSYLVGCAEQCTAVLIDPCDAQFDRYCGLLAKEGLRLRYVVDTHTHADHFSGAREIARHFDVPAVMHRNSSAIHADLRLDDGDTLIIGSIRMQAMHTPGHTADSMCLRAEDRVFTGDTLLIGGTGRTDLPTGDPEELYDSLFQRLLKLPPDTIVQPAHDYKGRQSTTIGRELAENPRLQKRDRAAFVAMMRELNLTAPDHLTEALRTNLSGGLTVDQLLAAAAAKVPFIGREELAQRIGEQEQRLVVLDVREQEAFALGHIPGAIHLPRGQLELRVNTMLPDPTAKIVTVCELGKISTLAAATLRDLGFGAATALDGGMKDWGAAGLPVARGPA